MKRVIKFIFSYVFHAPLFVVTYAVAFFLNNFSFKVNFYSHEEVKKYLEEGKSLIRIGDGEVHIMLGGDISYQKYEKQIDESLRESIKNYHENSPYLLGVNELVMDKTNEFLKTKNKFYLWLPMKVFYFLYFKKNLKYFDASLFYYDGVFDFLLKEYLHHKKVIIITPQKNIEKLKNSEYGLLVEKYIEAPEPNPHNAYSLMCKELDVYRGRKDIIVLLSCGPTSKVLAYHYSQYLQCIDLGIGLEVLLGRRGLVELLEM